MPTTHGLAVPDSLTFQNPIRPLALGHPLWSFLPQLTPSQTEFFQ